MPRVWLKIQLPQDSLGKYSLDHPDDEFRILASHRTENGLRVIVDAKTPDPKSLRQVLDAAPEVRSYEELHTDQLGILLQIKTAEHESRIAARTAGMLPQYPMILRNGWQTIETIISWKRLSNLKAEFEERDISFEILSISQSIEVTDLLTDRQWEVLNEAITQGYYDSPRSCSLTDLADILNVNPSAVSGILHRAEEQIIKSFAAEAKQLDGLNSLN